MNNRTRPNGRRSGLNFKVRHEGHKYHVLMGWRDDKVEGPPIEVFIHTGKVASEMEALMRDGAILISFALQYGASLQVLKEAVTRDDRGNPSTAIGAVLDEVCKVVTEVTYEVTTDLSKDERC